MGWVNLREYSKYSSTRVRDSWTINIAGTMLLGQGNCIRYVLVLMEVIIAIGDL